jgi:predicted thioredoxin/glutaredoxin
MPEITNIHEWQNWRMGAGKQENILDNINTHRSLLHQIFNIAVNRFTWEGLPEGLPSNKIEEWLLTRGSVGAFPSDIGNIIVPITHGGINIYG